MKHLKAEGYSLVIVEQTTDSIPLQTFTAIAGTKYCLVFGNEVNGVSEEAITLGDFALEIPQLGTKHSLNISVCLGIVLWEVLERHT